MKGTEKGHLQYFVLGFFIISGIIGRGVIVVTDSNIPPKRGVMRQRHTDKIRYH